MDLSNNAGFLWPPIETNARYSLRLYFEEGATTVFIWEQIGKQFFVTALPLLSYFNKKDNAAVSKPKKLALGDLE